MFFLILAVVGFVVWFIFRKQFKTLIFGAMAVFSGGLKAGKSTISLYVAKKTYDWNVFNVKLMNFFLRLFRKKEMEMPLFYSTIPLSFPHVRITKDLLKRNTRFAYKSVVWIDEASLLADCSLYKDGELNAQLLEFAKLFAHETKGGCLILVTHDVSELHISLRRVCSRVFHVVDTVKWLPFFLICTVREERYSEGGQVSNVYEEDLQETLKRVIVPKKVWKYFDCYCYSSMTDDLPIEDNAVIPKTLKTDYVTSFSPLHEFKKKEKNEVLENEKENCK